MDARESKYVTLGAIDRSGDRLRILLIEDSHVQAHLIRKMLIQALGDGFDLTWADNLAAGLGMCQPDRADVVLLDLVLPDSEGIDTVTRVHTHAPEIPIIVLTVLDGETVGLEALERGAQDYLIKERVAGPSLARAIHYAIARKRVEHGGEQSVARPPALTRADALGELGALIAAAESAVARVQAGQSVGAALLGEILSRARSLQELLQNDSG